MPQTPSRASILQRHLHYRGRFKTDAVSPALTEYLHLKRKTELIGDRKEGSIVVPKQGD